MMFEKLGMEKYLDEKAKQLKATLPTDHQRYIDDACGGYFNPKEMQAMLDNLEPFVEDYVKTFRKLIQITLDERVKK